MRIDIQKKKKLFIYLNILLIVVIAVVLYQKFLKGYKSLVFDCNYNSKIPVLTKIIEKSFPDIPKKDLQFLAIFNAFPSPLEIETLNKVYYKYNNIINCFSLIIAKYKSKFQSDIQYKYYTKIRLKCRKYESILDKNFFLILLKGRVIHIQKYFSAKYISSTQIALRVS